ncbi:hypothetical protein ACTFR8_23825 [Bacillus cereus group sp. MYBK15-3]|uniref:hypothetical protein n=1 Tax=unclassified Bacillus cereus group TaxID=2750818 RepID=UPI003F7936C1
MFIVGEASATRYEIMVNKIEDEGSYNNGMFVVSLVNFGECFVMKSLRKVGEEIFYNSKRKFGTVDCANIQNIIASKFDGVEEIEYTSIR